MQYNISGPCGAESAPLWDFPYFDPFIIKTDLKLLDIT